jgi:hypothetical protein
MPRAGFEPATPATKQPQTYALDRATIGIGDSDDYLVKIKYQPRLAIASRSTGTRNVKM